ncbi:MAG: hypothetical protein K5762_03345 [Bacilli bacterium]|nr:hypothetical protein [Bacilli bacterium]
MKRTIYQIFVYVTLAMSVSCFAGFIYEMSVAEMNVWAILCLVLAILGLVGFVLNQILYRQFKQRDESRYEQVECPHCHEMNSKKDVFCKKCGKNLY